jgi:hypothetical protein
MANSIPHIALGKHFSSNDARKMKSTLNPYKDPLWDDFNALIEQAVIHQKASLYSDLNEEMKWALGIAALRENKERAIDAEFGNLNELIADVLESKGSFKSLRRLYDELVVTIIESKASQEAHVAYCIDSALEKEEDKQAFYAAYE